MSDFKEIRFPDNVDYGLSSGARFKTEIVQTQSGFEQRNIIFADALKEYNINSSLQDENAIHQLIKFNYQVFGAGYGFRLKDWVDYYSTQAEGVANEDELATGAPKFQLYKKYSFDNTVNAHYRIIQKPVLNTVKVYLNNIEQTTWTVNYTTGVVTMTPQIVKNITDITKSSNAVVTSVAHGLTTGDKIYIKNVVGMTQVNNKVYTITSLNADTFALNINSTLYSNYISGGVAEKYAINNITWEGEFDVPVRFAEDMIPVSIDNFNSYSYPARMNEIRIKQADLLI